MNKAIFFGTPAHGHTNPTLPIVKELVSQGERIIYYSSLEFKEKIESTGAEFRDYNIDVSQFDPNELTDYAVLFRTLMESSALLTEQLLPEVVEIEPDYIIHDSLCSWGKYIAQILNIPAISSVTTFALNREAIFKTEEFRPSILKLIFQDAKHLLKGMAIQYHLGKKYGIPRPDLFDTFTNQEELNLVYTAIEFQPYAELFDSRFAFVGPSILTEEEQLDFSLDTDKPIIYISLGTLLNENIPFYHNCFTAFENIDVMVVLSVGEKIEIADLGDIPDNFIVRNHVPQVEVLRYADLFITHGGMNSVHEGLFFAVPLIVIPLTREQEVVARQVSQTRTGIHLQTTSPLIMSDTATQVLNSTIYGYEAWKMSQSLRNAGGYKRAVAKIQTLKQDISKEASQ